ncbi:MAG TPA: serine hydrolase domain-containing protein [Pseudonocardiaceae bacterium]|nr:serine hydrolase domain-containing protein [Pseudonocardiaceae bacterium]
MSDQQRSLPSRPNVRYLKIEAKRRLAAGEFATLHDAQLAIAREHGLSSWTALKQLAEAESPQAALAQLHWLAARFTSADEADWTAPDEAELREHFDEQFLSRVPPTRLVGMFAPLARLFRAELVVTENTPTHAMATLGDRQLQAVVTGQPPHRLVGLRAWRPGTVTDPRLRDPRTLTGGEVPAAAIGIVDAVFAELGLVALTVACGRSDAPVWTVGRGWADLDRAEIISTGHRFPAGSLTTLITATAVLRLVAEGLVELDAPANRYPTAVRIADPAVTVRELLSHTGGVDSPAEMFGAQVDDLLELTGPELACSGVRGEFAFSNGGYAVLGELIAAVTGSSFAESAARLVLEPLAMADSTFEVPAHHAATGYELGSDGIFTPVPRGVYLLPGAAGLWTSAADLARFGAGWSTLLPAALAAEALPAAADRPGGGQPLGLGWRLDRSGELAGMASAGHGAAASLVVRIRDGQAQAALASRALPIEPVNGRILRAIG